MDCQLFRANQDALKEKILLQSDIYLESLRHCEGEYSYQDCDIFFRSRFGHVCPDNFSLINRFESLHLVWLESLCRMSLKSLPKPEKSKESLHLHLPNIHFIVTEMLKAIWTYHWASVTESWWRKKLEACTKKIWLKLSTHRSPFYLSYYQVFGEKTSLFICSHNLNYSVQRLQTSDHIQLPFHPMKLNSGPEVLQHYLAIKQQTFWALLNY